MDPLLMLPGKEITGLKKIKMIVPHGSQPVVTPQVDNRLERKAWTDCSL